jgi:hypothetical protein
MIYGFIFGFMDIEDLDNKHILTKLIIEENYCVPIGGFFGLVSGLLTCLLGNREVNMWIK